MRMNLADQFASLWNVTNAVPDVVAFLDEHKASTREEKISVLLVDQRCGWRTGKPNPVEWYLERFPELASDDSAVLKLAVGEIRARKALGKPESVGQLVSRFSHLSESLQSKLSEDLFGGEAPWQESLHSTEIYSGAACGQRIGRYRLIRVLGEGTFGRVWLAFDDDLERPVAVKVPTSRHFQRAGDAEAYLAEARKVATLDHPNIVPVHDVGRANDGSVYIVSKYIDGQNLATTMKQRCPEFTESTRIVARIAAALHHAHQRHLIHRDVKPGNILIEQSSQRPYLADFGLAIREEDYLRGGGIAGTPSYMSPEQARGEGHRLDGRSDIFSLGIVFYVLLTGRSPFWGDGRDQILQNVISKEPTPPRDLDRQIPSELQRICLKALSKRASDRYATGREFAEDLQYWLAQPDERSGREIQIVPKGLRAFDDEDAGFFLELLPGPRNRDGLPDSIQFWKKRLEQTVSGQAFTVGLLYGPSGCGKSSLMKAGVLPNLSQEILKVYFEATPEQTETRLLSALRKQLPGLPEYDLVETFAFIRRQSKKKLIVVLDQFEQWLHVNRNESNTELVRALRQCDGSKLQAVCLIRDDFAMAAARFMHDIDVPILQGHNFATVDLFDVDHARRVLAKFGQAYGRLPEQLAMLSEPQQQFLEAVASGLARDNKVVCVQLVLLAEMIKDKPWTLSTLKAIGGTEGIGANFLEETFNARIANPKYRFHQQAARRVLRSLLPDAGTDIKGCMRSYEELLAASGYSSREAEFHDLLRCLDSELRLITPTDPDEWEAESRTTSQYYQLTHDYLVPSLRTWLTRKQKETRQGRAELRLQELAALWKLKPETRHLPSLCEWMRIRVLTEKTKWSEPERRMMHAAARARSIGWTVWLTVVIAMVVAFRMYVADRRADEGRNRAQLLIDTLQSTPAEAVPYAIQNLAPWRDYAVPILRRRFQNEEDPDLRLRAAFALAQFERVPLDFVLSGIKSAGRRECPNIVAALTRVRASALPEIHRRADAAEADGNWTLKARLAIVALHLGDPSMVHAMVRDRPDPIQRVVFIETLPDWHDSLDQLLSAALAVNTPAFRSGVCLGIGKLIPQDLPSTMLARCKYVLRDWYQHQPDGATHSAAGWALRQWQTPLPEIPSSDPRMDGRQWHVNTLGMTMVRIPPGRFLRQIPNPPVTGSAVQQQTVVLTRPTWLCDREVSRAQFQRFIDDPEHATAEKPNGWKGATERRSPTLGHPVQQVSWIEAVLFCNWLSDKEGLPKCYEPVGGQWRLMPHAQGYRLPFEAEWEHACRAGTTTDFACGSDVAYLTQYAVILSNHSDVCGSRMPNAWGLFDTHGNVYEWCQDRYEDYGEELRVVDPRGAADGKQRVLRSGAFHYEPTYATSSKRTKNLPIYRSYTIGFRVAANGGAFSGPQPSHERRGAR